jgi:hypothetical protein
MLGSARVSRAGFGVTPKRSSKRLVADSGTNHTTLKSTMARTPSPTRETRVFPRNLHAQTVWADNSQRVSRAINNLITALWPRQWRGTRPRCCVRPCSGCRSSRSCWCNAWRDRCRLGGCWRNTRRGRSRSRCRWGRRERW